MGVYNQLTNKQKNKTTAWNMQFCEVSYFDKDEKLKTMSTALSFMSSRFYFLALQGFTPLQAYSLLKAEQIMGVDSFMLGKTNTQNSTGDTQSAGAPTTENPTDNTTKSRDKA